VVIFGDTQERKIKVPLMAQMKTLSKNYKLYYLSYWYFITFGAFVAFGTPIGLKNVASAMNTPERIPASTLSIPK
jgi:nitrate/nitrite transporter NarK